MPDEGRKKVKVGTRVSAEKLRRNERETKHQMKNNFENLKKGQELESNTQAQKAGKQSPKMSKVNDCTELQCTGCTCQNSDIESLSLIFHSTSIS